MLKLEDLLTPEGKLDKAKLHLEIIKYVTEALGYDFGSERLQRIADDSQRLMDDGWPFPWAYAGALDTEIILYGNSSLPDNIVPLGILNS